MYIFGSIAYTYHYNLFIEDRAQQLTIFLLMMLLPDFDVVNLQYFTTYDEDLK